MITMMRKKTIPPKTLPPPLLLPEE